jgi:hypothetical protein
MSDLIRFRVRPGYGSKELLVEICGDHRASDFPNVPEILRKALHAKLQSHPDPKEERLSRTSMLTDRFITYWVYAGGSYETDDDWGGFFVTANENNSKVISDIERSLLQSGLFAKEG